MNWGFPNVKQFNNFVPSQFTVSVDREILNENLALFYSMSRIMCHFVSSLHFIFVWSVREIKPHWGRPPPENSMRKPQHSSTAEDFINMTQIKRTLGLFQASKFLQWFPCWDCSLCCDWGEMIASHAWRHTHPSAYLQTPGLFQHPHAAKQVLWKPPGHRFLSPQYCIISSSSVTVSAPADGADLPASQDITLKPSSTHIHLLAHRTAKETTLRIRRWLHSLHCHWGIYINPAGYQHSPCLS